MGWRKEGGVGAGGGGAGEEEEDGEENRIETRESTSLAALCWEGDGDRGRRRLAVWCVPECGNDKARVLVKGWAKSG